MKLTTNELQLFRNYLLAKRAYRNTPVPLGAKLWEEWMDAVLDDLIKAQVYLKKLIEIRSHQ